MNFDKYLLLYLTIDKRDSAAISLDLKEINKTRFWGVTLILVSMGYKIQMYNGHYLTVFDCFIEMEDAWLDVKFEGGTPRAWWEQFQWLRGDKKPYWIE